MTSHVNNELRDLRNSFDTNLPILNLPIFNPPCESTCFESPCESTYFESPCESTCFVEHSMEPIITSFLFFPHHWETSQLMHSAQYCISCRYQTFDLTLGWDGLFTVEINQLVRYDQSVGFTWFIIGEFICLVAKYVIEFSNKMIRTEDENYNTKL